MPRLACIVVPLFPLAARLRSEPELKGEAVAVFEGDGTAARVVAATRRARKTGVRPGMTLAQARALLPKLFARGRDRESERAAQEALLEVADAFSPRVEDAGEGVVYFDLTGLPLAGAGHSAPSGGNGDENAGGHKGRPYDDGPAEAGLDPARPPLPPGEGRGEGGTVATHVATASRAEGLAESTTRDLRPELLLAQSVIAAAERAGLPARVGLASSKLAARVAAGLPDSPRIVPPGEAAAFLAPLPLERLAPEIEIAATLERWGVRSVGELARLPEREIASRLGEIGRQLHATARGVDPRPLEPRLPPLCLSEGMDLEWPLVTLEPFLFLGNAALERLVRRLESQALACVRLELLLKLDPDGRDTRAIGLPAPTRETKTLLTLVRLELEARPPGAPVTGFLFTAHPDRPRRAQLSLFGPAALSADRLATTIARLASMLGAGRIGSPRAVDGHRPERFAEVSYAPPPPPDIARPPREGRGLLSVRILRPPVELEVITGSSSPLSLRERAGVRGELAAAHSSPLSLRERAGVRGELAAERSPPLPPGEGRGEGGAVATHSLRPLSVKSLHNGDGGLEIAGAVRVAAGPWFLEEAWWSEAPVARDYWDVELSEGGLYRIYRDRANDVWFADGVYD